MKKSSLRVSALVVLTSGCMFGGLGCLSNLPRLALEALPGAIVTELLLDSDAVFDLFGDGNDGTEAL